MLSKKRKIATKILFIILLLFIAISSYFALNYNFRRATFFRVVAFINLYEFYSIRQDVIQNNIKKAAKKINNYINFSQKISKGKNAMWQGIYDVTYLASSKAKKQNDFNQLEEVYLKLIDIDPNIYMVRVWLAKALSDNDYKKSLEHLHEAIKLSPANEEAYREMIRIYLKVNNDEKLIYNYCTKYSSTQLGGNLPRNYINFFGGNNLSKFSISLNLFENNLISYSKSITKIDSYEEYEISLINPSDVQNINIHVSFLPGVQISVKNILLRSKNKLVELSPADINFFSKSSYLIKDPDDEFVIIKGDAGDDIMTFHNNKKIKSVDKIIFNMKISRLSLTNQSICDGILLK